MITNLKKRGHSHPTHSNPIHGWIQSMSTSGLNVFWGDCRRRPKGAFGIRCNTARKRRSWARSAAVTGRLNNTSTTPASQPAGQQIESEAQIIVVVRTDADASATIRHMYAPASCDGGGWEREGAHTFSELGFFANPVLHGRVTLSTANF